MVELIVGGLKLDLPDNVEIKATRQIADVLDISTVSCSYTNSFELPKTPNNTQALKFLGIPGDTSPVPYQRVTANLKSDGYNIISSGWLNISETSDTFKCDIIYGMIDFFKVIENKTLGNDLDLSNFEHSKTIATVVDSYLNPYYEYIIADYGGKTIFEDGINIDYLAPCFSVRKLWELIFATFGFNCDYSNLGYLNDLYITYPKDIAQNATLDLIAHLEKYAYTSYQMNDSAGVSMPLQNNFWYVSFILRT